MGGAGPRGAPTSLNAPAAAAGCLAPPHDPPAPEAAVASVRAGQSMDLRAQKSVQAQLAGAQQARRRGPAKGARSVLAVSCSTPWMALGKQWGNLPPPACSHHPYGIVRRVWRPWLCSERTASRTLRPRAALQGGGWGGRSKGACITLLRPDLLCLCHLLPAIAGQSRAQLTKLVMHVPHAAAAAGSRWYLPCEPFHLHHRKQEQQLCLVSAAEGLPTYMCAHICACTCRHAHRPCMLELAHSFTRPDMRPIALPEIWSALSSSCARQERGREARSSAHQHASGEPLALWYITAHTLEAASCLMHSLTLNHTHICEGVTGQSPLQHGREVGCWCAPVLEHLVGAAHAYVCGCDCWIVAVGDKDDCTAAAAGEAQRPLIRGQIIWVARGGCSVRCRLCDPQGARAPQPRWPESPLPAPTLGAAGIRPGLACIRATSIAAAATAAAAAAASAAVP